MTSRTHDLAAFTSLTVALATVDKIPDMSLATALVAFAANFLGGLFPDLDKPTASFWKKFRGGSLVGRLIAPLMGGHRLISHSLLGLFLAGWLLDISLVAINQVLLVDMYYVWWAFMLGMGSHLVMDALTKDGIPLLFPLPWRIGFPPLEFLRITTGKLIEKALVSPSLMLLSGYLIWGNRLKLLNFLNHLAS